MKRPIYLDYCSTTPCDPKVVEAMLPYFSEFSGNASSTDHYYAWLNKEAVERSKEQIADLLTSHPNDIFYTSGATESINWAIKGLAEMAPNNKKHFITSQVEHSAVLETFRYLEKEGFQVSYLPVDKYGQINLDLLKSTIKQETLAICCMYANNELGTIYPIKEMAEIAKEHDLYFVSDATQAVGKIPIDLSSSNIDLLAFSSHKIYGPKGIGGLIINNSSLKKVFPSMIHGGKQEGAKRAGTINVPAAVGFGMAAELCKEELSSNSKTLKQYRDKIESALLTLPGTRINGSLSTRLSHISNITFKNIEAETLLLTMSKTLAISRGSACSSIVQKPSHVLKAIGLDDENALNSIRISLGRFVGKEEIDIAINTITKVVLKLQESMKISSTYS
ncbi:cysteine desulfurase family protein [Echinicola shivajiensis]|uniref:cysteine desulfurase family protein n=1 Tax=Echinicola shivajiensis TaxID=1035916 RepID=UPI001BFC311F|nr:cysteine desulfurase family protein [Echinicola shivajiensis]